MSLRDVADEIASFLNDDLLDRMGPNEGSARQAWWNTNTGWAISYTTSRIEGGINHGKFAVMAYKPTHRDRKGCVTHWDRTYLRAFSTRKAAKARALALYRQHTRNMSPAETSVALTTSFVVELKEGGEVILHTKVKCPECGRVFDLTDETQADEWFTGHDCEVTD